MHLKWISCYFRLVKRIADKNTNSESEAMYLVLHKSTQSIHSIVQTGNKQDRNVKGVSIVFHSYSTAKLIYNFNLTKSLLINTAVVSLNSYSQNLSTWKLFSSSNKDEIVLPLTSLATGRSNQNYLLKWNEIQKVFAMRSQIYI